MPAEAQARDAGGRRGAAEGALSLFREADGKVVVYAWMSGAWAPVGPVTEPKKRTFCEDLGTWHDLVVSVEVDSASKGFFVAPLGVNYGDDAVDAAKVFCARHGLPAGDYVEDIAGFVRAHGV